MTTKKLLIETLNQLSPEDFAEFKSLIEVETGSPVISKSRLKTANMQDAVELMMKTYSRECVEVTRKALMKMNRTDLVQRLSDKRFPPLSHRVETMESVIERLLETLADLNYWEDLRKFLIEIHCHKPHSHIPWMLYMLTDLQNTVFFMVQTYGEQSVEMTMEVFKDMKKTDLARRLSDSSSKPKIKKIQIKHEKHLDEHLSALIHKVAVMAAIKELLLEILEDLSEQDFMEFKWFLQFTCFQKGLPKIPLSTNTTGIVNVMVEMCSQQSVEVAKEIFSDMNRTDLVQRLIETSSGLKEKQAADKHWPALIEKIEMTESVIELLLETLADLSYWELKEFKEVLSHIHHYKPYSDMPWLLFMMTDLQDTVFLMVQTYGQRSVEKTMEGLKAIKRTDLVQRLSDCSSEPKKIHSVDEQRFALIHKVAIMAAVKHLLLETLTDLSDKELKEFKRFFQLIFPWKNLSYISRRLTRSSDRGDIVDLMVDQIGWTSVEVTREVFMYMNRTDLMQKLSETSSGSREKLSVDEHEAALLKKEETLAAVKKILLETLNDLSQKDLEKFRMLLPFTCFQKDLPQTDAVYKDSAKPLVYLIVERFGQQSVEVTREVFIDMKRTDLVQRLLNISSGSKEKHQPSLSWTEASMTSVMEKLLETLEDLSFNELEHFKRVLQQSVTKRGFQEISTSQLERADVVKLMVQICPEESMEVTREVLTDMNRTDLVQRLSDISSGSKGQEAEKSLKLEGCGSTMDSSDWTKLEPEVNSTDADETPTYSLQSEAGHFQCSVSGLRWVCKEKASFQYQFSSWEGHIERMESRQYMPAGPLMDITVTAGKLNEVHLPHWICIDEIPDKLDMFAVLHIDECGDVVEKVLEVTPSHVKLTEPILSPRAVLIKVGIPVKINCNVLIYQTNTAFLTLHVYLVPRDPGLQQAMDQREVSCGYKVIRKPHPEKSLKMFDRFILRADLDGAEICPEELKLRYESRTPNFFEVYIKNPDIDFQLKLTPKKELQPVWTRAVRKDEYQRTGNIQENHFVDKHRVELIQRVSNVGPILDELLKEQVIQQERYDRIRALPTSQDKMRELYNGPLKAGSASKDVFYKILQTHEGRLVNDLC